MAVNSLFGWVLSGSIWVKSEKLETTNLHSTHVLFSRDIAGYENSVRRFWDLEILGTSKKDAPCYHHYIEDIRKNSENRYEISLPFKENRVPTILIRTEVLELGLEFRSSRPEMSC